MLPRCARQFDLLLVGGLTSAEDDQFQTSFTDIYNDSSLQVPPAALLCCVSIINDSDVLCWSLYEAQEVAGALVGSAWQP